MWTPDGEPLKTMESIIEYIFKRFNSHMSQIQDMTKLTEAELPSLDDKQWWSKGEKQFKYECPLILLTTWKNHKNLEDASSSEEMSPKNTKPLGV